MRNTSFVLIALGFLVFGAYAVTHPSLFLRGDKSNTAALLNAEPFSLIIDNTDTTRTIKDAKFWESGTKIPGYYGSNYVSGWTGTNTGESNRTFTFSTDLPTDGEYGVSVRWVSGEMTSNNVLISIAHANGVAEKNVNQRINGADWVPMGTYTFLASKNATVTLSTPSGTSMGLVADAVRFVRVSNPVVILPPTPEPTTAPTLTLSSSASSVTAGGNATLSWSSTNATSCTASGSWSGIRAVSGSDVTSNITTNKTYTLTCVGAGGTVAKSVSVGVTEVPVIADNFPPTLTLSANPTSIDSGKSSTINWSASPASSCSSSAWDSKNVSGSVVVSPSKTTTYTVSCINGTGGLSKSGSVTISVAVPTQLSEKFKINDQVKTTSKLKVRFGPSLDQKTVGNQSNGARGTITGGPVSSGGYWWWQVSFANGMKGWSVEDYLVLSLVPTPEPTTAPTLTFSSSASSVTAGGNATLSWSSTNTTSCTASGSWSGIRAVSGSDVASNITTNKTYTLTCVGAGGTVAKSVSVGVTQVQTPSLPVPMVSLTADITSGTVNSVNPKLTWSATNSPTSCTATGSWSGIKSTSGSGVAQGILSTAKTYTYTLTCSNTTGTSVPVSVTVNVLDVVAPPPTQTLTQVSVSPNTRYQMINGWEATAQAGQGVSGFSQWQTALMNLAVNDLGINRIRVEISSGAENSVDYYAQLRAGTITSASFNTTRYVWVNDNNDSNLINPAGFQFTKLDESFDTVVVPLRQRIMARGESLYVNLNYVSFGNSVSQQNPNEYAELILAAFQHLQSKYGFVPNAVEVILEPDNNTIWSGWNSSTAIGQAIAATGARLAAAGFRPDFIAPSVMNMSNAVPFLNQIVAVPGALQYLKEVSYHRYSGVSDANLVAIKDRASQYGLRTSMLEHIGSGVEDLYKDLTLANVSAWQQYTLAFPTSDNGAQYYNIVSNVPVMGSRTFGLRQYFQYVRSGAYRVGAASTDSSLRPVAFTNPNGKAVVVIHVDQAKTVGISGLPAGSYEAVFLPTGGSVITSGVTAVGGVVSVPVSTTGILTVRGI